MSTEHDSCPLFYFREFLNEESRHGLAAVLAEIHQGDDNDEYLDHGATLTLSDCNRQVTLDFGVFGVTATKKNRRELRDQIDNARHKAAVLRAALLGFSEVLEESLVDVEARLDAIDAQRAAKKAAKKARKEG